MHVSNLRRTTTIAIVIATSAALGGLGFITDMQAAQATELHTVTVHGAKERLAVSTHLVKAAAGDVTAGRKVVAAAEGKVLDQKVLDAATDHVSALADAQASLDVAASKAAKVIAENSGTDAAYWRLSTLDKNIGDISLSKQRTAVLAADETVAADKKSVDDAVTAWTAEQARIAAERKAAAAEAAAKAAAEKAAAQAAQAAAARATAKVPAPASPSVASGGAVSTPAAAPAESKQAICSGQLARWGFTNVTYGGGYTQGHYGATDLDNQHIYIALDLIPTDRVASVCIHEYEHIKQARLYGGYAQTVAHFGSVLGMERAADQAALADGATWVNYL